MMRWNDVEAMIFEPTIDRRTEEKMLRGTLHPEDAPPELARVALVLRAASAGDGQDSGISETDRFRQEQVVASMVATIEAAGSIPAPAKPATVRRWKLRGGEIGRLRLVVTMALGLVLASAGLAFAGALPNPVQHAASVLLSKVGVHVPDPNRTTGSPQGHEPRNAFTYPGFSGGDHGRARDLGNHTGQLKNGNNGRHTGQTKGGKGTSGAHGSGGGHGGGQAGGQNKAHRESGTNDSGPASGGADHAPS
jgi:hypothetical protein